MCGKCGVDVRDDTLFCYNCGASLAAEPSKLNGARKNAASSTALDDLAAKLRTPDRGAGEAPVKASSTRRPRVVGVKGNKVIWEPATEASGMGLLVGSLAVAFVTFAIVFLLIIWK